MKLYGIEYDYAKIFDRVPTPKEIKKMEPASNYQMKGEVLDLWFQVRFRSLVVANVASVLAVSIWGMVYKAFSMNSPWWWTVIAPITLLFLDIGDRFLVKPIRKQAVALQNAELERLAKICDEDHGDALPKVLVVDSDMIS